MRALGRILLIPGTSNIAHLRENLAAAERLGSGWP
jgi:aryl-alcohol dehydrogenase-like predicted oxidoreductase